MNQTHDTQATTELIEHTLASLQAAAEDLARLTEAQGGISALVHSARGTALIHDLRLEINKINKLLPFKS